jgi:alcohol dehydrogenase (cytochrome c)
MKKVLGCGCGRYALCICSVTEVNCKDEQLRKGKPGVKFPLASLLFLSAQLMFSQNVPDSQKNPFAGNPAAVSQGKKLFDQACAACHGSAGHGGRGPALAADKFHQGDTDFDLFQNIRNGIPGTQMPSFSVFSSDGVWQLVAYIRSLSSRGVKDEALTGNAAAGEKIFFGKGECNACHEVNERGAVNIGPDLSDAGQTSAQALRKIILNPNSGDGEDWYSDLPGVLTVKMKDGREIRGIPRSEDTYAVVMTDITGQLQLLDKGDIREEHAESSVLMPSDYGKRLSAREIDDLVAYLKSQKQRDFQQTIQVEIRGGLSYERRRHSQAEPQNWLTYWDDYQGHHFSALNQITAANAVLLKARWARQMPGPATLEATPLAVDGILYTSGSPGQVFALDARTGLQIWKYERKPRKVNPYGSNPFNRGVAVLGSRVFFGTLDAALVALDARSGRPLWETQVADTMRGYSLTSAPLAIKDKVIVGVAGGEFGIRGFVDAYDAATGKRLWRFNAVPGPGEFGHDTWKGDSWKQGGASTWLTGSYDPDQDVLYWGIGNPGPDHNARVRQGDNLFSCSVVALDAATGKRKWHYQFSPGDSHDWDAAEDLILADQVFSGEPRKLILQANRNGLFYVLDRTSGKFLLGKPFVRQTWNRGFDSQGRPIVAPEAEASPEGVMVYPGIGGTNWQAPSYDAATGTMYLAFSDAGFGFMRATAAYEPGKVYMGGRGFPSENAESQAGFRAIDTETGAVRWEYRVSMPSFSAGVLSTAGGVVFGATAEGNLIALDAKTGGLLWQFQTGAPITSSPMSYAVQGRQFVAVAAGNVLYSFSLPEWHAMIQ